MSVAGFVNRSQLKNTPQIAPQRRANRNAGGRFCYQISWISIFAIINLRTADGTINRHVSYDVPMGLIKSDQAKYGRCLIAIPIHQNGITRRIATTSPRAHNNKGKHHDSKPETRARFSKVP